MRLSLMQSWQLSCGLRMQECLYMAYEGYDDLKTALRSLVYAAPALWNELPKDVQFAHPLNSAVNFTSPPLLSTHD